MAICNEPTHDNTARTTATSKVEGRLKLSLSKKKKKILDKYLKSKS